ncbi:MAG: TIGR03009 domain-containing protein [Pirellulales bacterium]
MNRSIRRVATLLFLIGFLSADSSFGQQGRLNSGQPQLEAPALRGATAGNQRSANPQRLQANDGWQRGEEPRGGVRPIPQQSAAQPQNNRPAVTGQAPPQPRAPFTLTPQEEFRLDQILIAWEKQSSTIKTYKCEFARLEYGAVFGQNPNDQLKPRTDSTGELKYSAPDKGMFKVTSIQFYNPKTGEYDKGSAENLEHWVCDGKSIFEINHKEKTRTERRLPPEMQGTAISDGPLPFVFGAKAATLKQRYWMREIPPPVTAKDEIWLQAFPRFQADAANFKLVEIIIGGKDFMPKAIQMFSPAFDPQRGNDSRTVFSFKKTSFNGALDNVFTDFVGPDVPFHYKKIVLQPAVEQPTASGAPAPRGNARSAQAPTGRSTR